MGFIFIGLGEKGLIGCHQGHIHFIGHLNKGRLGRHFLGNAVALKLNIQAITEERFELFQLSARVFLFTCHQKLVDRPRGTTRQANQTSAIFLQDTDRDVGVFG